MGRYGVGGEAMCFMLVHAWAPLVLERGEDTMGAEALLRVGMGEAEATSGVVSTFAILKIDMGSVRP